MGALPHFKIRHTLGGGKDGVFKNLYPRTYAYVKVLNIRPKIVNGLQECIGNTVVDLGIGDDL